MGRHTGPSAGSSRRLAGLSAAVCLLSSVLSVGLALSAPGLAGAAEQSSAVTLTKTVTRTHLIDGKNDTVDTRHFSVSLSVTKNLRDRQGIDLSWSGAHPTGGVVFDVNSAHAADQEYPVVILQCRGVDSTSVPAAQRLSQQTCFTQTPSTRYQGPYRGAFPSYRLDRYESAANRAKTVGAPTTIPSSCISGDGAQRWVPFKAVDGTTYYGGYNGCAGLAPEQSIVADSANPSNETFGTTGLDGTGSARFIVEDAQDNASLGCSDTVACSLVIVPIMGISCDAAAASLPDSDRPPAGELDADQKACTQTGFYEPGQPNGNQNASDPNSQVTVNGQVWWSASNWRNRLSVPLGFAATAASCPLTSNTAPLNIYGSEYLLQATQQWAPAFCSDPKLYKLLHTQTSEVQAKNLLATGITNGQYLGVKAAFQAEPPSPQFHNPIVQAPTAISGFAISYVMDDAKGHQYAKLKLDARLLAKLLTMSYPVLPAIRDDWASNEKWSKYKALAKNPLDMSVDPEFLALNPGMKNQTINQLESSAALFVMSSDSDVMTALTSYLNNDPEARAFLDGTPDPWGMVVNPNYRKIALPVTSWPLLDQYYNPLNNECIADNKLPYLPLVAGQVADPAQITFNMQFGISASLTNCVVTGATDSAGNRRLSQSGAEQPGIRFLLGLVSLGDAQRYGLQTASLETGKDADAPAQFTDSAGRYFVAPTGASLKAAAQLMRPDDQLGTWVLPDDAFSSGTAGRDAYPGTLLLSTDVPTAGLTASDARRFSQFLQFVAGAGQVPGPANGQLAGGYLPITDADGLGLMHRYTVAAAAAVAQGQGFVPKPSDPITPTTPSTSVHSSPSTSSGTATGSTSSSTSTAPAGPGASTPPDAGNVGGGGNLGGGGNTASVPRSPSRTADTATTSTSGEAPSPSTSSSPVAQSIPTPNLKPGWSAHVLPVLAIIALASGAIAAWASGIGRTR